MLWLLHTYFVISWFWIHSSFLKDSLPCRKRPITNRTPLLQHIQLLLYLLLVLLRHLQILQILYLFLFKFPGGTVDLVCFLYLLFDSAWVHVTGTLITMHTWVGGHVAVVKFCVVGVDYLSSSVQILVLFEITDFDAMYSSLSPGIFLYFPVHLFDMIFSLIYLYILLLFHLSYFHSVIIFFKFDFHLQFVLFLLSCQFFGMYFLHKFRPCYLILYPFLRFFFFLS